MILLLLPALVKALNGYQVIEALFIAEFIFAAVPPDNWIRLWLRMSMLLASSNMLSSEVVFAGWDFGR